MKPFPAERVDRPTWLQQTILDKLWLSIWDVLAYGEVGGEENPYLEKYTRSIFHLLRLTIQDEQMRELVDSSGYAPFHTHEALYSSYELLKKITTAIPNLKESQQHTLRIAFILTQDGFKHTKRKSGKPYFEHIVRTVRRVLEVVKGEWVSEADAFRLLLAAILHDSFEDLDVDEHLFTKLFGAQAVADVDTLSKQSPREYIQLLPPEQKETIQELLENRTEHQKKNIATDLKHRHHKKDFWQSFKKKYNIDYIPAYGEGFDVLQEIANHSYFDQKMEDPLLIVKFADRIDNISTLNGKWSQNIKKIIETQTYFQAKGVQDRIKKFKNDENSKNDLYAHLQSAIKSHGEQMSGQLWAQNKAKYDILFQAYQKLYHDKIQWIKKIQETNENDISWEENYKVLSRIIQQEQVLQQHIDLFQEACEKPDKESPETSYEISKDILQYFDLQVIIDDKDNTTTYIVHYGWERKEISAKDFYAIIWDVFIDELNDIARWKKSIASMSGTPRNLLQARFAT